MRNRAWLVPLMWLVGVVSLGAQGRTSSASDSARLQGTWTMVSGSADGFALPPDYVKAMKRVFVGSEVTVTMRAELFFKATIRLDADKAPRTIDYQMTGGPTAGAVQLGIYSLSGDTARFCFSAPNAPRPGAFTTTTGDGRTLSTWVRSEPHVPREELPARPSAGIGGQSRAMIAQHDAYHTGQIQMLKRL